METNCAQSITLCKYIIIDWDIIKGVRYIFFKKEEVVHPPSVQAPGKRFYTFIFHTKTYTVIFIFS